MSDGNFNRNPLPYRNYQSGLRAGRATMRTQALRALEALLAEHFPNLPEDERATLVAEFKQTLE